MRRFQNLANFKNILGGIFFDWTLDHENDFAWKKCLLYFHYSVKVLKIRNLITDFLQLWSIISDIPYYNEFVNYYN